MATSLSLRDTSAVKHFDTTIDLATDNPWVVTAWMVLKIASDRGDEVTIDACTHDR